MTVIEFIDYLKTLDGGMPVLIAEDTGYHELEAEASLLDVFNMVQDESGYSPKRNGNPALVINYRYSGEPYE